MIRALLLLFFLHGGLWAGALIEGKVLHVDADTRTLEVEILKSESAKFESGAVKQFRVSRGDAEIGYLGRRIRANVNYYNKAWHLEQVFPIDGAHADTVAEVNRAFREKTVELRRGKFLREGDAIPNFGMIDQNGDFMQIKELHGKAFVLNFIFTRCAAPKMCPASSTKMEQLQEQTRAAGLENLHFVTISFDPAFDSPGILRTYAKGYGFELENFHLLTGTRQMVDDILRQFGILTIEEDGTINHTMATLLVDADGRVAYRKEGPSWKVRDFLKAANKL